MRAYFSVIIDVEDDPNGVLNPDRINDILVSELEDIDYKIREVSVWPSPVTNVTGEPL